MTKSLKTVVMPDGSTTQILTSKPFTHAIIFYNPFYDGWTVKRWEESRESAEDTYQKQKDKKMKELGFDKWNLEHEEKFFKDHGKELYEIVETNLCLTGR